jgi:type VI secretion system secreted protein VgrG
VRQQRGDPHKYLYTGSFLRRFRRHSCDKPLPLNDRAGTGDFPETKPGLRRCLAVVFPTTEKGSSLMSNQNQNPGQQNQNPGQKPGQQQGGGAKPGQQQQDPNRQGGQGQQGQKDR